MMKNMINMLRNKSSRIQEEENSTSGFVNVRPEASLYNPWGNRLPRGNGTSFGAVFIVVNAALGGGLLSFPLAFYQAGGYIEGIAIELVVLIFVIVGALILAYGAEQKQKATYEDAVEAVCGPVVKLMAELCLLLFCFGSNIAYLVIIGDQLKDVSSGILQSLNTTDNEKTHIESSFYLDRRFMITVAACLFILPWLFFKKIGVLTYTSFLAVLCCFYIAIIITVRYVTNTIDSSACEDHTHSLNHDCSQSWPDIINAIPFICFGYQCHVSSIPVYVGLKKRSVKRFFFIVICAVFICFIVYTLTGTFGYLSLPYFSPACIQSDIVENYCPGDIAVSIARGVLALVIVTSYPILTFCGRTPLDSILVKLFGACQLGCAREKYKWVRLRIESLIWFVLTLTLAIVVKEISNVVSFTGGLAATFIFVYPGMMIIQFSKTSETWSLLKKTAFVTYGCFTIVIGSYIFGNSVAYTIMHDIGLF